MTASRGPQRPSLPGGSLPDAVPGGPLPDHLGPLAATMRIALLEAGPERVVATMPVEGNTQPFGLLHGGASALLAETVGSVAANLHAGPGRFAVGIELNATHHRSARAGTVTATAAAVHRGGTLATYDVTVVDDAGRRLCSARLTCLVRPAPAPPSEGRDASEPTAGSAD